MARVFLAVLQVFIVSTTIADDMPMTAREHGLMLGSPPAAGKLVTIENFLQPPYNRWSLRHLREVVPTRNVAVGESVAALGNRPIELSALQVSFPDGRTTAVGDWLEAAYTDGFIVLHQGDVVYERYLNDHTATTQHLMFSVTKSFTGTILLMLMEQGRVDADKLVAEYIPELEKSAFGNATVQHMLDMTNSIHYIEDYYNPDAHITGFLDSMLPGGEGLYANLQTLTEHHEKFSHGDAFHYVTPDPEVLGWIIRRITGGNLADALHEMIWAPLGAEHEGYFWLDFHGVEMAGGGLAITLRDAARFGQMILQDGYYNDRQVISEEIAQRIKTKRNADKFNRYYNDPWFELVADSYHDQWWGYTGVDAVAALGIHGQFIYVNSDADVVIAKHSSDPDAESERVDSETAFIMHAIADYVSK
ncbi:MAG: beta-lactamase family protein [Gammaproteobacteria bacterium]|nr:beta-lactamase family protein [Gammaproteobacteria bacterium]